LELVSDIRFACRVLARRPTVPLLVAALFALGVGLAGGMWAVVDAAVLRPLPYRDGDALVAVMETHPQRGLMAVTPANFLDWATRVKSLENVGGGYAIDGASAFKLLGIPLVHGRLIEDRDFQNAPYVAVISAALSRRHWPNENPIGRRIVLVGTDKPVTIVGVVADVRQPISKDPRAESLLYLSYRQFPWPFMTVMFAPAAEPGAAVAAVRQEVARLDSSQAAGSIQVLDDLRTEWLGQPRLQTTVVTLFGLGTLLLTLVGLYARMAHSVAVRAREFAIRQALGARPTDVVRRLTVEALAVVAVGVLAGVLVLPLSTRTLRSLVIDAPALDMKMAAGVALLLGLGALASTWPARRAGRIDPAQLLKAEQ
jgi:putative ABC transport system permease protein